MQENHKMMQPRIAVVEENMLAAMGLRQLLQEIVPVMAVDLYNNTDDLVAHGPDGYAHFFASMNAVLSQRPFYTEHRHKTIVLTTRQDSQHMVGFHCINVNVPEEELVRSLLNMLQHAHPHGRNLPAAPAAEPEKLTPREIEVLSLIVLGNINKEIAEKLHIGLTTVITHRKNIMEKLGVHSVSALTVYAVMRGYVDIGQI